MLFYTYGPAPESSGGPHDPSLNSTWIPWEPTGPHRIQMSPEASNPSAFHCLWAGTGKVSGSAWTLMEPHLTPMEPHRIPPVPDEPESKGFQCISMHMGRDRKGVRVHVDPHGTS